MRRTVSTRRRGFTLIELLVVIGIIALLAAMLLSAFSKARDIAKRTQTAGEIHEMELAIESFKSTYQVNYIPTALILSSNYAADATANPTWAPALNDSRQYLSKVWPKVSWGGTPNPYIPATPQGNPIMLDGNQCLVFLLGGVGPTDSKFTSGWAGNRSGFLNSPNNPFNMNGGIANSPADGSVAKAAFFNFKVDRLDANSHYRDPYWDKDPSHQKSIYYYFSSRNGNDYSYFGIYRPALNPGSTAGGFTNTGGYGGMEPFRGTDGKFVRSDAFQIISPGKNAMAGSGGVFTPGIGSYSPSGEGGDDVSNFHKGQLGGEE